MVNRDALFEGMEARYGALPQFLWAKFPQYAVFRHENGKRKWFAVYLPVAAAKIGRQGNGTAALLNLKCPPELVGALRQTACILPAYHMNKEHWISVVLDEADEDLVWQLTAQSRRLTEK